jgi:hypothetical protein
MQQHPPKHDIEIAVTPHSHRAGWSTLRVHFARRPDQEERVARALDALVTPRVEPTDGLSSTGERRADATA